MGAVWGNDRPRNPRPIRDGAQPWTRAETVVVTTFVAALVLLAAWATWGRQHGVQRHLDQLCHTGDSVACALDGRR